MTMQHLSGGVCIHWCIKQKLLGRGHSPGGFHWEKCSKYVGKISLFAFPSCKLTLSKSITHQCRWECKCFSTSLVKYRDGCCYTSITLAPYKCLTLHHFHVVWLLTLLPLLCASPVSSFGQSLTSVLPPPHPVSRCLLSDFFDFNWCVFVLSAYFNDKASLLGTFHLWLTCTLIHSRASLFCHWAPESKLLLTTQTSFPCALSWHVQDRK